MNSYGRILEVLYNSYRLLDSIVELRYKGFNYRDICSLYRLSIIYERTQSMVFY